MKPDRNDLLHVETCALIVVAVAALLPMWVACIVALLAGIGKELYDREHGGVPSWGDIICDCAGVALGALLTII